MLSAESRTAQSILPAVDKMLTDAGWEISSLDLIAVSQGPGSFTGLRIGVTVAKTMAYALAAELIGVDSLAALAHQSIAAVPRGACVHTIADAQRGQLFAAAFVVADGRIERRDENRIVDPAEWLPMLSAGDVVTGTGMRHIDVLPDDVIALDETAWKPDAQAVGQLARQHYAAGRRDDLWRIAPAYYRLSAAEEKAQRK